MMQTKRGWTLIELLVVMAIIAVLAGIIYALVAYAVERSSQARCISNFRQIGIALKLYMEDYKQADWDTEVGSIDCERIQDEASFALVARWGFPDSLLGLVSAGYLKGGEDVLRCRSVYPSLAENRVHYFYQLPIRITRGPRTNISDIDDLNLLCRLKKRLHEYPIAGDSCHWRPGTGGVFIILRLNDQVETRRFGPLEIISSWDM
jgi:prepilin-type N-terminal cleavage/methylation domain-containing protein